MAASPSVRVVVRLPYNRPEEPFPDPPKIEWTQEKADILWKVIEKSRSADAAGADWKALAEHLKVPLPYLLYRVNARFQEEIRGLKDIQGALSPTGAQPPSRPLEFPSSDRGPSVATRALATGRISSPNVRIRLSSLNSLAKPKKVTSSSTLTLQAAKNPATRRDASPPLSDDSDSSDDDAIKEGDEKAAEAEAEEALNRKLADLQRMMTSEALGLVADPRLQAKGKAVDRGRRSGFLSPQSMDSSRVGTPPSRSGSVSHSISSTSSQNGSIPEIPSTSSGSQPRSPRNRPLSSTSSSPHPLSPRGALGPPRRPRPLADRLSDLSSNQGSEASSFSDISEAEFSASALESAIGGMSNFGTGASRLSQFARSRAARNTTAIPQ